MLAREGASIAGEMPTRAMARLRRSVGSASAAAYEFEFAFDDSGRATVCGWVEATVQVCCQRCLQAMELVLRPRTRLLALREDQAHDGCADAQEALVTDDHGRVALATLIEDELLLALPLAPRHGDSPKCRIDERYAPRSAPASERRRPLAALAALRNVR